MAAPITAEAQAPITAPVDAVPTAEEVTETLTTPAAAPEDIAATTVVEPLKDEVNPLPTVTHAEAGTAHTEADPALNVAGEQADKVEAAPTEVHDKAKDTETADTTAKDSSSPKKESPKEKTEKIKSEGKGFFAKLFSSGPKTPKKPKVKTPKTEQAEPVVQPTAQTADSSAEPAAVAAAPGVTETEAPVAPPKDTVVGAEPEETHVTETAPVEAASKPEVPAIETAGAAPTAAAAAETEPAVASTSETSKATDTPKSPKVSRRLSARLGGFMKTLVPKKEHHEDAHKEETAAPVSEEAPKIEQPEPIAPLEEPTAPTSGPVTAPAPAVAPAVATAA